MNENYSMSSVLKIVDYLGQSNTNFKKCNHMITSFTKKKKGLKVQDNGFREHSSRYARLTG